MMDIQAEANRHYASRFDDEMREMIATITDGTDHNATIEAEERLMEMPLSFEKLITHHRDETITWEILLGTGGPADRVLVVTDHNGAVVTADYQYQDWFQPWTSAENQDGAVVQRFAEIVGYYEPDE